MRVLPTAIERGGRNGSAEDILTITVPLAVPSLFHNSVPLVPSLAREIEGVTNGCESGGEPLLVPAVDILDHHRAPR